MRLPKDYRFQGSEVAVKHVGNGVLLLPVEDPWATLEAGLASFEPGFSIEWQQPEVQAGRHSAVILLDTTICIHVINARPFGALDTMIAAHAVSRARW